MKITVMPGDGIGPSIMASTIRVLDQLNLGLSYTFAEAGTTAQEKGLGLLPSSTIEAIRQNGVVLKGPLMTPIGAGFSSINVLIRKEFDLFANVRPTHSFPGVASRYTGVNLTMVRENTEGLYIGQERYLDDTKTAAQAVALVTRAASLRVIAYAFELARKLPRRRICVFHKANILKLTSGLFLNIFREVGATYPDVEAKEMIIDNGCMQLVLDPTQFDIIVTTNMFGDIVSDLCAGLVGGLGLSPSANIGHAGAMFEAVHGSAPDIAGKNLANPTALILSAAMMLDHIGLQEGAARIRKAVTTLLGDRESCTRDLGGKNSTTGFTEALLEHL